MHQILVAPLMLAYVNCMGEVFERKNMNDFIHKIQTEKKNT